MGRQQGRGRFGGRGRGRFNKGNSGRGQPKANRNSLSDHMFNIGTVRSSSDFTSTKEFIINYIKNTFEYGDDIAYALERQEEYDFESQRPLRIQPGEGESFTTQQIEDNDLIYQEEVKLYVERKDRYRRNQNKAFALLEKQCTKGLLAKIRSKANYEDVIKSNPIEMIKTIKEIALSYQETKYDMAVITDATKAFINLKQREGESLIDYTTRFKHSRDIYQAVHGKVILYKTSTEQLGYPTKPTTQEDFNRIDDIVNQQTNRFYAYLYLENSDRAKYGSLITGLATQKALGTDQYPATLADAIEVLSNRRFNKGWNDSHKKKRKEDNKLDTTNNEDEDPPPLTMAQIEGKCYCCGSPKHRSNKCPEKGTRAREDWVINKAAAAANLHTVPTDSDNASQASMQQTNAGKQQ